MGELEFAVVVGCGLLGFIIVNFLIDRRREKMRPEMNNKGGSHQEEAAQQQSQKDNEKDGYPPWWVILNVDRNDTTERIKRAFRREIAKYHPDRVEGLGEELRELADRKSKDVNNAYTAAKKERHFN
jgi:DnaJ-domain-containing protein 1